MNTSKLNGSYLNNSQINYLDLDLDKIIEFIKILEEHQNNCEKSGKFVEAELSKQKIIQLKKIEAEKVLNEVKDRHNQDKLTLEEKNRQELEDFNKFQDEKYFEITQKHQDIEEELIKNFEVEIESTIEKYNQIVIESKPSVEILNQNKILEKLVKQKDYINAHLVQTKISDLTTQENQKNQKEKELKINKEIDKLRQKHEQEFNTLKSKHNSELNEFNTKRAIEFDRIVQKYKNQLKDINNLHKLELNNINKISKTTTRPNSRGLLSMSINDKSLSNSKISRSSFKRDNSMSK